MLSRAAALVAEADGISCDVLDLRSLLPWDVETVSASVATTGRLLVAHEAPRTGGFGAELVSELVERCFLHLEAPPARVCVPWCQLAHGVLPACCGMGGAVWVLQPGLTVDVLGFIVKEDGTAPGTAPSLPLLTLPDAPGHRCVVPTHHFRSCTRHCISREWSALLMQFATLYAFD